MCLHHERGPMIVEDLLALPASPLTIAEGTPVTPPVAGAGRHAVWLLPSVQVQRARLEKRKLSPGVLELYQLLLQEIETQVQEYGAQRLIVDGRSSVVETVAEVEGLFAAALEEGPTATTERRQLLRYTNRASVSQYQAYFARPWAPGDARTTVHAFACECGRDGCEEQVEHAIADFPEPPDATSAPVLAPGHSVP